MIFNNAAIMQTLNVNLNAVAPVALMTVLAIVLMVIDFFLKRENKFSLGIVTLIGLVLILPVAATTVDPAPAFGGMVIADAYAAFFNVVFIIAAIFAVVISNDYLRKISSERGEYYYIIIFATIGMMVMASANDLVNLYVGLELMSLSFYILVAMRRSATGAEGALKYFILGAFSSGILLYGITFTYGFAGTTNLTEIARMGVNLSSANHYLLIAIIMLVAGFAFKIAAFPFHLWSPDAYEGAPTPVTALLSVGSKAAAFAFFLRFFGGAFHEFHAHWAGLLWILSAATMLVGATVAIQQKNIVRMLAYSSIAHAGIILIGVVVMNGFASAGVMFYMFVYAFMNMGAFTVVALMARNDGTGKSISDYKGLAGRRPVLAFVMALFLLSLAGIPPTGGFTAKFFILASAIEARYYWLAAIGVISTVISLFFYAKVIFYMYMKEPDALDDMAPVTQAPSTLAYNIIIFITAVSTMVLGLCPTPVMDMAIAAVSHL
ncbi:MAG: NADH-quinone oxidoreductase subunit N [Deltaproteobacteria bacterium]|nr:NADH-quinone oxidoreductase subunit N [Deltaproteobacteria bacterium]